MNPPTVDQRVASFATLHHGHFRLSDLDEMRVTRVERRQRIESGRWVVRYDGVYAIAGVPRQWIGDLIAAVWAGGEDALASRRSAAALWQLPAARRDLVEITCPRWRRAREDGLVVHETLRVDPEDRADMQGVPVTTVERTIFDLAASSSPTTLDLANRQRAASRAH